MLEQSELACGACGCAEHRIRGVQHPTRRSFVELVTVCCGCESVTHVRLEPPSLEFDWGDPDYGEKNDGILCMMRWPEKK
jgi:hypothetical protein